MTTLRELSYLIDANTKGLEKAYPKLGRLSKDLNSLADTVNKFQTKFTKATNSASESVRKQGTETERNAKRIQAALKRQEAYLINTKRRQDELTRAIRETGAPVHMLGQLTRSYGALEKVLKNSAKTTADVALAKAKYGVSLASVNTKLREFVAEQKRAAAAQKQSVGAPTAKGPDIVENFRKLEASLIRSKSQVDNLHYAIMKTGSDKRLVNDLNLAYRQLENTLRTVGITSGQAAKAKAHFAAQLAAVNRQIKRTQSSTSSFADKLEELSTVMVLAVGPLSGIGARMTALSGIFNRSTAIMAGVVVGVTGLTAGLGLLSASAIRTAYEIDTMNAKLLAGSGSAYAAEKNFEKLVGLADRLGLNFINLSEQYGKFMTAASGTKMEGTQAERLFEQISATAAKLRLPTYEVQGIFKAFEQMISKGTVSSEELRHQLGDRLPGAFQIAAKAMGVTTKELGKMMKAGEVISSEFLPKFGDELARLFNIKPDERFENLRATTERFGNALTEFNMAFSETFNITNSWIGILKTGTSVLKFFIQNMEQIKDVLTSISIGFAVLALPKIISLFISLAKVVRVATAAMIGLNAATLANPFVAVLSVVVRLGAAIAAATTAYKYLSNETEDVISGEQRKIEKIRDYIKKQKESLTLSKDITKAALAEIGATIAAKQARLSALDNSLFEKQQNIEGLSDNWFTRLLPDTAKNWLSNAAANDIAAARKRISQEVELTRAEIKVLVGMKTDLDKIFTDQENEERRRANLTEDSELSEKAKREAARRAEAMREAVEDIQRMQSILDASWKSPQALEDTERHYQRVEAIDKFRDALVKAKVAQEDINRLTSQYSTILLELDTNYKVFERISELFELTKNSLLDAVTTMSDSLVDLAITGEASVTDFRKAFQQMAADVIKEILRIMVYKPLLDAVLSPFGGSTYTAGAPFGTATDPWAGARSISLSSAKGNAFGNQGLINIPSLHTYGGGNIGEVGEKNKEAIMPLMRDGSGRLGVMASGGGDSAPSTFIVAPKIKIIDQNNSNISTRRTQEDGVDTLEILVGPVNEIIRSGRADGALKARTGGSPRPIKRGSYG